MWDQLRRELGAGFEYGPECWFCLPHEDVSRPDGRLFSEHTGGSGRPVVIASDVHPNPIMFARPASRQSAIYHRAHVHDGERESCALDMDGWIVHEMPVTLPVTAPRSVLSNSGLGCSRLCGGCGMMGVMQGTESMDRELLDVLGLCWGLVREGSVYRFLAEHRLRLFGDGLFADLFGGRGRR